MGRIKSMADLNTPLLRHRFFKFALSNFEPGNHVCWYCIQQYKAAPSKRMAIFIYDTFLEPVVNPPDGHMGASVEVLSQPNIYDSDAGVVTGRVATISGIGQEVGNIRKVKTRLGKLKNPGLVAQYKHPAADLFDSAEAQILSVLTGDWFHRFDTDKDEQMDGRWSPSIQRARRLLKEKGFDPDAMGVYG